VSDTACSSMKLKLRLGPLSMQSLNTTSPQRKLRRYPVNR